MQTDESESYSTMYFWKLLVEPHRDQNIKSWGYYQPTQQELETCTG